MNLFLGDCLKIMDQLIDKKVVFDSIIADIPFGKTKCKWDSEIPLNEMWDRINKLIKPNGAIVLYGINPFTSALIMSNVKNFRYTLVYEKTTPTGHLNAKKMPLRSHEDIIVFYKKLPVYNPQKTSGHTRKTSLAKHKTKSKKSEVYGDFKNTTYDSTERYPKSVLKFSTDKQKSKLHPTQKPLSLMEYLVKTYTNERESVLDFTMGSGTTGVACKNLNRNFTGIELDKKYFKIAKNRINKEE